MCPDHSPLVPDLPAEATRPQMPLSVLRAVLGDLVALGGTRWIDLVGIGEPLAHPHFLEWAAEIKQAGFGLCLSTNGALLTEEKAGRLAEMGVDRINVSINAGLDETYREIHPGAAEGNRRRVLAALRAMNERCDELGRPRPVLALSAVVFRATYRDATALVESAAEVGAEYMHFHQIATVPATAHLALSPEEAAAAREAMREAVERARALGVGTNASTFLTAERPDLGERIRCYAGQMFTRILADGQVRFCCGCEWVAGNVNEQPFREIWRSRGYAEMRRLALGLARSGTAPSHCSCFTVCPHLAHNLAIHNLLFPARPFPTSIAPDPRLVG